MALDAARHRSPVCELVHTCPGVERLATAVASLRVASVVGRSLLGDGSCCQKWHVEAKAKNIQSATDMRRAE